VNLYSRLITHNNSVLSKTDLQILVTSENCACDQVTKFGVTKLQSEYLINIYINK